MIRRFGSPVSILTAAADLQRRDNLPDESRSVPATAYGVGLWLIVSGRGNAYSLGIEVLNCQNLNLAMVHSKDSKKSILFDQKT